MSSNRKCSQCTCEGEAGFHYAVRGFETQAGCMHCSCLFDATDEDNPTGLSLADIQVTERQA